MASSPEARRGRWLLAAWLAGAFALSALRDLGALVAASLLLLLLFRRGAGRSLARTVRLVLPAALGLSALSVLLLRWQGGAWPPLAPFAALLLRSLAIAFATFAVLSRVDLPGALAPFPALSRLLAVALAQIHALRLLATESRQGLQSRLPRRPGARDLLGNAGGITAALFALSARNAREISDAMRSRGF